MPFDPTTTLIPWRHHLHANPEVSLQEKNTAAFVCEKLTALGIDFEAGIGGHGVVATLSRGASNRSVGLRADMDALPIAEITGLPYASTKPGVMHACGHDGHTTSLLGAAALLKEDTSWSGTIRFIFQPAEEGFGGAAAMLADGLMQRFPFERIFGYHNWPGLELGQVMVHDGAMMAAACSFSTVFTGRAGHAAMPHLTIDPVPAVAHLVLALNTIIAREIDPLEPAVISTCKLQGGDASNQIPTTASCGGTVRAVQLETMDRLKARLTETAAQIASAHHLTVETNFAGDLPPTVNDTDAANLCAAAARGAGLSVRRDMKPTMGAEDFGRFLLEVPGAYAWIGNGDSAGLHHPAFDYNDALLPIAARYLTATAKAALA
jgi:hippurate hydrolase